MVLLGGEKILRVGVQIEKSLDHWSWGDKMTQWFQVPDTKPHDPNLILGTHMVEENWFLKIAVLVSTHMYTYTHQIKK